MQVKRNVTVSASHLNHIRHQARRDGHARLVFLVRAGVAQVRHNRCNARCRIQPQGLQQDEQAAGLLRQITDVNLALMRAGVLEATSPPTEGGK